MSTVDLSRALELAEENAEAGGIGRLAEKLLHRALKYYYEPDGSKHEIEVGGYFADILNEDGVTEIQTGSFFHIDKKLEAFLEYLPVTLVCPVVRRKRIVHIDPATGEETKPRLSQKKGRTEDVFRELIHIRKRLAEPNLVTVVPLVDCTEYRVRRGERRRYRDKGYDKLELRPTEFVSESVFVTPEDWLMLLPEGMDGFTAGELSEKLGIDARTAGAMCASLVYADALTRERPGKAYVYYRNR